jgi:hypothetical protein
MYEDRPPAPAKIVSARPATIWLARRVMTRNAWISASAAPATAAIRIAIASATGAGPPMFCTDQKPITAPPSIMPSTPRFSTPERSASSSPSAEKRSGVP